MIFVQCYFGIIFESVNLNSSLSLCSLFNCAREVTVLTTQMAHQNEGNDIKCCGRCFPRCLPTWSLECCKSFFMYKCVRTVFVDLFSTTLCSRRRQSSWKRVKYLFRLCGRSSMKFLCCFYKWPAKLTPSRRNKIPSPSSDNVKLAFKSHSTTNTTGTMRCCLLKSKNTTWPLIQDIHFTYYSARSFLWFLLVKNKFKKIGNVFEMKRVTLWLS